MKAFLLLLASVYYAVIASAFTPTSFTNNKHTTSRFSASSSTLLAAMPICIVVEAEIKEDRMDEFLSMIEANAIGSRKEPGCIRFGR